MQEEFQAVIDWTCLDKMQLSVSKTKESLGLFHGHQTLFISCRIFCRKLNACWWPSNAWHFMIVLSRFCLSVVSVCISLTH